MGMRTFYGILKQWPESAIAGHMGVTVHSVSWWKIHGIPSSRWPDLIKYAAGQGTELTADDLLEAVKMQNFKKKIRK